MTIHDHAVRVLSRVRSVFFRLIISYAIMISLTAIAISTVAFLYFQNLYNQGLETFHRLYLENIVTELETQLVNESKAVFFELSTLLNQSKSDLFLPGDDLELNAAKVSLGSQLLKSLVAQRNPKLEAIHLYYVRQDMQISTTGVGLRASDRWAGDVQQGLEEMRSRSVSNRWSLVERPAYYGIPSVTLFRVERCFPILSGPDDCDVVVALDFRKDFLEGLLARLGQEDVGTTLLLSPDSSSILAADNDKPLKAKLTTSLRGSLAGITSYSSQTIANQNELFLLSVSPLGDTGWFLGNIVSHQNLYQRGDGIKKVLVAICVIAIVLGIILARFISSGIYNPLGRRFSRIRSLMDRQADEEPGEFDEFRLVDRALDRISDRMDELQATINANRPVIRNDLLTRLLSGSIADADTLKESLSLLGLPSLPANLVAGQIDIGNPRNASMETGGESSQIMKYRIVSEFESGFPGFILAGTLQDGSVGLLIGSGDSDQSIQEVIRRFEDIRQIAGGNLTLAIGFVSERLEDIPKSRDAARILAGYHFIFPGISVFRDRPDLADRIGASALPSIDFLEQLRFSLGARDTKSFGERLGRYLKAARGGNATPAGIRSDLARINLVLADFSRNQQAPAIEKLLRDLLAEADNLDAYIQELIAVANDLCAGAESPQRQRNTLLVGKIKEYIHANLAGDLSLDKVGDAVAVSPGYMCKIFKDETGSNFLTYITEIRLQEAASLLSATRLPIQEIGRQTGFNSPAYFIRQFKGRYGQTPLEYRRSNPGSGLASAKKAVL